MTSPTLISERTCRRGVGRNSTAANNCSRIIIHRLRHSLHIHISYQRHHTSSPRHRTSRDGDNNEKSCGIQPANPTACYSHKLGVQRSAQRELTCGGRTPQRSVRLQIKVHLILRRLNVILQRRLGIELVGDVHFNLLRRGDCGRTNCGSTNPRGHRLTRFTETSNLDLVTSRRGAL